ncbi:MAG: biotin/lipoyl-binding protein [Acidobacteria bacterium]|nr:biotin/lipoyl-binding protein [Acidobacteriota bacterium]
MQYDIEVNGRRHQVTVTQRDGRYVVSHENRTWVVDAASVSGHTLSLLVENGSPVVLSHEVSIAADPVTGSHVFGIGHVPVPVALNTRRRFGRKDEAASGGAGPQKIVAPMPGKVVRIVRKPGDLVAHRQPVVVIEAMKMENELRASRDGVVAEVLVQEGQSVEAGALLAIISPA